MLSIGAAVFQTLTQQADERGISIQELVRAVILPQWLTISSREVEVPVVGPSPGQVGNRWPKD
jgi:hypothetical protein